MASVTWNPQTPVSLMTTQLNSLANGAVAASVVHDNAAAKLLRAWFELVVTFASAPTVNTTVDLYAAIALDGTNYGDYTTGASGRAQPQSLLGSFVVDAKATVQRLNLGVGMSGPIELPPYKITFLIKNGTGVAMSASGNVLSMGPVGNTIA